MKFSISVIIPVYNGGHFIEKAIKSALQQTEIFEIIVIDDGSTDDTLEIVEQLKSYDFRIKIYHHKNKENKGRSASRNLGIKNASANYIAFLDADDFYLANRFKNDKQVFDKNNEIDGVYNAIGVHFYRKSTELEQDRLKLTTIRSKISYEKLFETLLSGKEGHFSIDGLTVKKSVFKKVGYFSEELEVSEDTELIFKMALKCRLEPGLINEPVAKRGVHDMNVSNNEDLYKIYTVKMYESLFFWTSNYKVSIKNVDKLLNLIWLINFKKKEGLFSEIRYWMYLFFNNLKYLFSILGIKYFPLIRLRQKLFPFFYK